MNALELDGATVNGASISVSLGPNSGVIGSLTRRGKGRGNFNAQTDDSFVISVQNDRAGRNRKGRGSFRFGSEE